MSRISDSLREQARHLWGDGRHMSLDSDQVECLADRIDAEMVELPRAADGPIHLGDTVFTKDDPGTSWGVRYIELSRDREPSIGIESGGVNTYRPPSCLTHERPDSWERIADEMEEWSEDNRINGDSEVFDRAAEFSERIRRLAKER